VNNDNSKNGNGNGALKLKPVKKTSVKSRAVKKTPTRKNRPVNSISFLNYVA